MIRLIWQGRENIIKLPLVLKFKLIENDKFITETDKLSSNVEL